MADPNPPARLDLERRGMGTDREAISGMDKGTDGRDEQTADGARPDTSRPESTGLTSERGETEAQRIDRNWVELLQELRITQTGGQVLTGFLLIVPFQEQFAELGPGYRALYLVVLSLALTSTILLVTPVMIHRIAFRSHRKDSVLARSNFLAIIGLAVLGAALIGVVGLVFSLVLAPLPGVAAAAVMAALVLSLLVFMPTWVRRGVASENYYDGR